MDPVCTTSVRVSSTSPGTNAHISPKYTPTTSFLAKTSRLGHCISAPSPICSIPNQYPPKLSSLSHTPTAHTNDEHIIQATEIPIPAVLEVYPLVVDRLLLLSRMVGGAGGFGRYRRSEDGVEPVGDCDEQIIASGRGG